MKMYDKLIFPSYAGNSVFDSIINIGKINFFENYICFIFTIVLIDMYIIFTIKEFVALNRSYNQHPFILWILSAQEPKLLYP